MNQVFDFLRRIGVLPPAVSGANQQGSRNVREREERTREAELREGRQRDERLRSEQARDDSRESYAGHELVDRDASYRRRDPNQINDSSAASSRDLRTVAPNQTGPNAQKTGRSIFDTAGNQMQMPYQGQWLESLVQTLLKKVDPTMAEAIQPPVKRPAAERQEETRKLVGRLFSFMKQFANEFNLLTLDVPGFEPLLLSISDLSEVTEKDTSKPYGLVKKGATSTQADKSITNIRFRVATKSWCLSVRGYRGRVDFFLVPASELFLLSTAETQARVKATITLSARTGADAWSFEGLPVESNELYYVCRSLFKNLLFASLQDIGEDLDVDAIATLDRFEGETLKTAARELLMASQNMAQKIVSQQEEIQNRIARDLHDTVIADLMILKRALSGDANMAKEDISSALDQIGQRIREICHDLTPRDLRDWGLQTVIEDLLERISQRTGADCTFQCKTEIPDFPFAVQLHLFRIVQECLNNIEKYAGASRVIVKFEIRNQVLRLTMTDDGKGFEPSDLDARRAREGGTGLAGIRERAEMIRCFYPTKLKIDSAPGRGSSTILEMRLSDDL